MLFEPEDGMAPYLRQVAQDVAAGHDTMAASLRELAARFGKLSGQLREWAAKIKELEDARKILPDSPGPDGPFGPAG